MFQVPGHPLWFNIKYEVEEDEEEAVYSYQLLQDLEAGELKILV